ncbi:galectin-4-like [Gastrophryne carolinensis]
MASNRDYKVVNKPRIPFRTPLKGFEENTCLTIYGSVPASAHRFYIYFKNSKNQNTVFHITPRFDYMHVARNSKIDNVWGAEETELSHMPVCQSKDFQLEIRREDSRYNVYSYGAKLFHYADRLPVSDIDQFEISGDVIVDCIHYFCK